MNYDLANWDKCVKGNQHYLQNCRCNVKLNFTFGKEVMKGMESFKCLYINPEYMGTEFTTCHNDNDNDMP